MSYPVSKIFALTTSRKAPHYLTKEEVHRILSMIRRPRDQMLIDFLWNTGVRVSELNSIKVSDINYHAETITVRTLKQKHYTERAIPVPRAFLDRLSLYIEGFKDDDLIFPLTRQDIYYLVARYCQKAGIDKKRSHPHIFRHSFAVNCVLQGISGTVLAEWLGHAGLGSVMIYARALAKDTKHLRDGLEF